MTVSTEIYAKQDLQGNFIYLRVMLDENKEKIGASAILKLKSERKRRHLGNFDFSSGTFFMLRNSKHHYHFAMNGYGFNHDLLIDQFLNIKVINIKIDDVTYEFPKTVIDSKGSFLNFKKQGFELQRFLPFKIIQQYIKK
jgi:hypothetical protein